MRMGAWSMARVLRQRIEYYIYVKSSVLQQYGADVILETFMDGIKCLEQVPQQPIDNMLYIYMCTTLHVHVYTHTCMFMYICTCNE